MIEIQNTCLVLAFKYGPDVDFNVWISIFKQFARNVLYFAKLGSQRHTSGR
jgi:hypothetical protein